MQRRRVLTKAEAKFRHEHILKELKKKKGSRTKRKLKKCKSTVCNIETIAVSRDEEEANTEKKDVETGTKILENSSQETLVLERGESKTETTVLPFHDEGSHAETDEYDKEVIGNKLWLALQSQGIKLDDLTNEVVQKFVFDFSRRENLDLERLNCVFKEYLEDKKRIIDGMMRWLVEQSIVGSISSFKESKTNYPNHKIGGIEDLVLAGQTEIDASETGLGDDSKTSQEGVLCEHIMSPLICHKELSSNDAEDTKRTVKKDSFTQSELFKQDKDGDTYLHIAVVRNHSSIKQLISLMHNETLDVQNRMGQTPLHLAVIVNNHEIVSKLVFHGSSVAVTDIDGNTPLHIACQESNYDLITSLLRMGFTRRSRDLDAAMATLNFSGDAPLHLALSKYFESGNKEIVRLLLDFDCDLDVKHGKTGKSSLHMALENGDDNMAEILIRGGADVNSCTFSGTSPLHVTAQAGNSKMVQKLIEKGSWIHARTVDSESAKDLTTNEEVKQLLDRAMKKERRKRQKDKEQSNKVGKRT